MTIIWCMVTEIWSTTEHFFWFWTIFCPFTNLKTWKIKIFKKWKNCLEISFNTFATEMIIIWCMVPEIWSVTDRIFCHFWLLFCSFTLPTPQKIKILKKGKNCLKILSFYSTINYNYMMYGSWDMECDWQEFFVIFDCFFALSPT